MSSSYFTGQRVLFTGEVRDQNGALFDPVSLEFRVLDPSGATTTYDELHASVSNPSIGVWRLSRVLQYPGEYYTVMEVTSSPHESVSQIRVTAVDAEA